MQCPNGVSYLSTSWLQMAIRSQLSALILDGTNLAQGFNNASLDIFKCLPKMIKIELFRILFIDMAEYKSGQV